MSIRAEAKGVKSAHLGEEFGSSRFARRMARVGYDVKLELWEDLFQSVRRCRLFRN